MRIMERLVAIKIAAQALGVWVVTERRWEAEGRLIPERSSGGQPRYDLARQKLDRYAVRSAERRTIAYARVSSHDQRPDLERQKQVLEL